MRVALEHAGLGDRDVLENLLSLYVHDFSEILGDAPGSDGRYAYPRLESLLRSADRRHFLIRADDALAGLVFVSAGSALAGGHADWDMSEFFVVRGRRRRGVGQRAASAAFRAFPGSWEVRVMDQNKGALEFWTRTVAEHTRGDYRLTKHPQEEDRLWHVFRFVQPHETGR